MSTGPARRVGAETSKTRDTLLNAVERLMSTKGYAAVTYRAVAAEAGVTSGLVQYYFPTLDDIFVSAIRRRGQQNVDRLAAALQERAHEPLRVLWEYSREESTASLTVEFLALGNHRKSIRSEIAEVTEQVRRLQLEALRNRFGTDGPSLGPFSSDALAFLLAGTPKLLRLEEGVGVTTTHDEVVDAFEAYLDSVEPRSGVSRRRPASSPTRGRSRSAPAGRAPSRPPKRESG